MKYFAYGSNMDIARLEKRVGKVQLIETVKLNRYVFKFHKAGMNGSAKADAFYTGNSEDAVYGVLFEVTAEQKQFLDKVEGYPIHYEIRKISVYSLKTGKRYKAFTYYAVLLNSFLYPTRQYVDCIVEGAEKNRLPESFIAWLNDYPVRETVVPWVPKTKKRKGAPKSFGDTPKKLVFDKDGRPSSDPYYGMSQKEINRLYGGHYTD